MSAASGLLPDPLVPEVLWARPQVIDVRFWLLKPPITPTLFSSYDVLPWPLADGLRGPVHSSIADVFDTKSSR